MRPALAYSRTTSQNSGFSATSSSSAASSPPVLSRATSQTSLASDITTYSEHVNAEDCPSEIAPWELDEQRQVERICFVGAGYVGGPTAAVMAYCNPSITVTVVDMNQERISGWQSRHLPIHEPGLHEIVRVARDGRPSGRTRERKPNLSFSTDCAKHIATADIVFLSVNTPTKAAGVGAGYATDISMFESAARSVALMAKPGAVIVEKSTVPCRTADMVAEIFAYHRPGVPFEVLSNPEFLAEGTAVADLLRPSRVLIGSRSSKAGRRAAARLASTYTWVPQASILTVDVFSSELAKLVANAMLAQRISSINSISAICEKTGADVQNVARAIGVDPRIGSRFLQAGLGFGGSCFKKDILSLSYLAESLGLPEVAAYWRAVIHMNEWQCTRFVESVIRRLHGSLRGKKVAVLGYAFKKDTGDTRESQAAQVIRQLQQECPGEIAIFDPQCSKSAMAAELAPCGGSSSSSSAVRVCDDALEACHGACAVLILTEWDEFRYPATTTRAPPAPPTADWAEGGQQEQEGAELAPEPECAADCRACGMAAAAADAGLGGSHQSLDWARVASSMSAPRVVFDARGVIVDRPGLRALGLEVEAIGASSGPRA